MRVAQEIYILVGGYEYAFVSFILREFASPYVKVRKRALFAVERMLGGKIQVSNYEDFRDSLTLYQISDLCSSGKFTNIPDSAWRFWPIFHQTVLLEIFQS